MSDVFISHANQDGDIALGLAAALRAEGYSTWCYEEDTAVGASYLAQIDRAIERARAVVVVVSAAALRSGQVLKELVRAHEAAKPFLPLRRGLSHDDFLAFQQDDRRREWRMALGAAVSLPVDAATIAETARRVVAGLRAMGIEPGTEAAPAPSTPPEEPRRVPAREPDDVVRRLQGAERALSRPVPRLALGALVGVVGVVFALQNLLGVASTSIENQAVQVYRYFPALRLLNGVANLATLALSVLLLRALWRVVSGDGRGEREVRSVASRLAVVAAVWLPLALLATVGTDRWRTAQHMQTSLLAGLVWGALVALVPALLVRHAFRPQGPVAAAASSLPRA
jgi:hypothetical protein